MSFLPCNLLEVTNPDPFSFTLLVLSLVLSPKANKSSTASKEELHAQRRKTYKPCVFVYPHLCSLYFSTFRRFAYTASVIIYTFSRSLHKQFNGNLKGVALVMLAVHDQFAMSLHLLVFLYIYW